MDQINKKMNNAKIVSRAWDIIISDSILLTDDQKEPKFWKRFSSGLDQKEVQAFEKFFNSQAFDMSLVKSADSKDNDNTVKELFKDYKEFLEKLKKSRDPITLNASRMAFIMIIREALKRIDISRI